MPLPRPSPPIPSARPPQLPPEVQATVVPEAPGALPEAQLPEVHPLQELPLPAPVPRSLSVLMVPLLPIPRSRRLS